MKLEKAPKNLPNRPHVAVLLADRENSFWVDFKNCFEDEARQMGLELHCFWAAPNNDRIGQLGKLEELVDGRFNTLIINPLDNANLVSGIHSAAKRRIPVLDVGAKTDPDLVTDAIPYYVPVHTVNFDEQGRLAAEYITNRFIDAKSCHVAVVEGRSTSRQSVGRTAGALNVFAKFDNFRVVFRTQADFNRAKAYQAALASLDGPNVIDAWFCANDLMALGVSDAYATHQNGGRPVIVGVDLISEVRSAIASDRIDASVAFSRRDVARHVLAAAIDVINGRKPSTTYGVKSVLVTPKNLDTWEV